MRNPLNKRLPRELKSDLGRYLVIFFFMAAVIALISGFLVADDSMIAAYNESFDAYNIEDGNFELTEEAGVDMLSAIEDEEKLTIYSNYYVERDTKELDSTLRIYANRNQMDKVCLMDGALPAADTDIAIDRMYADNNELKVGDSLTVGGQKLTICGLVALSDYSAMFSDNSDMMFDAVKFGVAVVTQDCFKSFGSSQLHYNYSYCYDEKPTDDIEAKERAEDFTNTVSGKAVLSNFIPAYRNQAIHFTGDDMGGDKAMFTAFLYIVVVIIAFIFAVTTSNTISKESAVIGTLRASGYKKSELVRHYLTMPMLVVLVAAITGNIFGYTVFKDFFASMYYGSYSLPTFTTRWNLDAFIRTTVVPIIIMLLINVIILVMKLQLSPLKFLRHDLSRRPKKKAFRLNTKIKIMTRFRIRIIFQNMPNYFTLFLGILFANFVLLFGFIFGPMLDKYQNDICSNMLCDYQYILKAPMETDTQDTEKFCLTSLKTEEGKLASEEITVYGIASDSAYVSIDFDAMQREMETGKTEDDGTKDRGIEDKTVCISDGYAAKYQLSKGDTITLTEQYGTKEYDFTVGGIYDYPSTLAIFMPQKVFNERMGQDDDYFNGYFSNQEITDIEEAYIATTISQDDLTKVSRQLDVSMGDMMSLFTVFGTVMFLLLIYLLSKLIIEKNAQSISMVKILGYRDGEINRLYILATTIVTIGSMLLTMPICNVLMEQVMKAVLSDFAGWLPYYVESATFVKMFVLGAVSYLLVALSQMRRIHRISKSDALKNAE